MRKVVFYGDTHGGCKVGLCPDGYTHLDGGGSYQLGIVQRAMWTWWRELWDEIVPAWAAGEPFGAVHMGDSLDGVHHGATTPISHNLADQEEIAYLTNAPIVDRCRGCWYAVRGTEAHGGKSGVDEERLARRLGAVKTPAGESSWWRLPLEIEGKLIDCQHHIGTTGSSAAETGALMREIAEGFYEAGRWYRRSVDLIMRGHRHMHCGVYVPGKDRMIHACVTPGWQGKTPFAHRIVGARQKEPQFGAVLLTVDRGVIVLEPHVWSIDPPDPVVM